MIILCIARLDKSYVILKIFTFYLYTNVGIFILF